ncbi:MAG: hypothetical protein AAFV80_21920, partial [Bacteroidota bacterium]
VTDLLFNENPQTEETLKQGNIVDFLGSETTNYTCLREVFISNQGKVNYRFIENTFEKLEAIWPNATDFVTDYKAIWSAR